MHRVIVISPSGELSWGNVTTDHPRCIAGLPVLLLAGEPHGPAELPASTTVLALDADGAQALRGWASQAPSALLATGGLLTATEASRYYEQITGRELRKQHFSRWAQRGDIAATLVARIETRVSPAEVERLAREGLPDRGTGGRPRSAPDPGEPGAV